MTDKQLIKFVSGFVRGILKGGSPKDKCFIVCSPLQSLLVYSGVQCQLEDGYIAVHGDSGTIYHHHWWIKLSDGRIIDPTASQFKKHDGSNMPDILLGEKPSWYMKSKPKKSLKNDRLQ